MSAGAFYALTASVMVGTWLALSLGMGRDFHSRTRHCAVAVRPRWVPLRLCAAAAGNRAVVLSVLHGTPAVLAAVAAVAADTAAGRLLAAAALSAHCWLDSCLTDSHRDYANMYVAWALAVPWSDAYAAGAALGVCVHFIASSGVSKVCAQLLRSGLCVNVAAV